MRKLPNRYLTLNTLINAGFLIIGVLILIGPALQNGFPILHSDSGTYLLGGFNFKIPVSRPISYCLFVKFSSRIFSIWSVVIAQAVIVYWMIWLTVNTLAGKRDTAWLPFLIVAIASATTGLAFYVSQIMPDIFLPIALMGIFVILFRRDLPWQTFTMIGLMIWIALIVHMSNIPIVTGASLALLSLMAITNRHFNMLFSKKMIIFYGIMLISWVTNPLISLVYREGFRMSNSSNIVFFSRLLQAGAAQNYIRDKCKEDDQYYLCKYQDVIDGYNRLDVFLWNDTSFLYDHPCKEKNWEYCWRSRNEEFGAVNSEILAHPSSRKIYLKAVWNDFLLQLRSFELTTYISFKTDSHLDYPLKGYYKNDYKSFLNSHQFKGDMHYFQQRKIIRWTVYISLIMIAGLMIRNKNYLNLRSPYFNFFLMLVLTWLANGALTASLAVVSDRFLGRFIWLLPLLVVMMVYQEYANRKNTV